MASNGDSRKRKTIKRIAILVITFAIAVAIVSSTLGREIIAGHTPGLQTFGIIHFAGYLFFLLMPVEALVPYYQAQGYASSTLISLAVMTAVAAQLIDYGIGFAVSKRIVSDLIGEERYVRFRRIIHRHGAWAIFVFNLFPLSSPNLLLVSGMMRYDVRKAIGISLAGLIFKYVAIAFLFDSI